MYLCSSTYVVWCQTCQYISIYIGLIFRLWHTWMYCTTHHRNTVHTYIHVNEHRYITRVHDSTTMYWIIVGNKYCNLIGWWQGYKLDIFLQDFDISLQNSDISLQVYCLRIPIQNLYDLNLLDTVYPVYVWFRRPQGSHRSLNCFAWDSI